MIFLFFFKANVLKFIHSIAFVDIFLVLLFSYMFSKFKELQGHILFVLIRKFFTEQDFF